MSPVDGPGGNVAGRILSAAARSGVENLWFCSGSELTSFQEAAARARAEGWATPRLVTVPHEHVALSAAMGETMVSGRPAMTAAHADLGILHHGGSLHNAFRGGYPVLMMSGYPPTTAEQRTSAVFWYQQRWDQGATVRQYVKWDHRLSATDDAGLVVSRALQVALTPRQGPAYLAVPAEVGRLGAGDDLPPTAQELGIAGLGAGDPAVVDEIAGRLARSGQPLVIVERAGRQTGVAALLAELAELVGACVRSSRHRLNLSDDDPAGTARYGVADADVILVLDTVVPWIPATEQPRDGAWVAAIGEDPHAAEVPLYEFRADVRQVADPQLFLQALIARVRSRLRPADVERARARRAAQRALTAPATTGAPELTHRGVALALGEVMSQDDLLVSEVFDTAPVRRTRPGTLFEKGGSSLGWAQAAAIGARHATGRPTVAVTGDGSYLFGSPDSALWLQHSLGVPVLTVVVNNQGYRTGTTTLAAHYPHGHAMRTADLTGGALEPTLPYAAMMTAGGGFGVRVDSAADLVPALRAARRATEVDAVPALVEVMVPTHAETVSRATTTQRTPAWSA